MAVAVGKSVAWVNKLLRWRRSGYRDHSPFGPTTKRGRVEHAQQRSKASKPRKVNDADDAEASVQRQGRIRKQEAGSESAISTDTQTPTCKKPSANEAKGNLRYAIDHWW